ncbi:MAG: DUF4250 domain-containing protein [Firmicutes bacterium]|nr:DUF4250 domain-containing protein [Bacillota bacterium]
MKLPKDKFMLLSYVNTQLRDNFSNLDELCIAFGEEKEKISEDLESIGYFYNEELNAFK